VAIFRRFSWGLAALAAFTLVSCGHKPLGNVSGSVTCDGKPITYGQISFEIEEAGVPNRMRTADIRQGKYSLEKVPVGRVKVAISSVKVDPNPGDSPKGSETPPAPPTGPYIAVPSSYAQPSTSGLSYEVKEGNQTKDFSLP